jgi:hypothetical protein
MTVRHQQSSHSQMSPSPSSPPELVPHIVRQILKIRLSQDNVAFWRYGLSEKYLVEFYDQRCPSDGICVWERRCCRIFGHDDLVNFCQNWRVGGIWVGSGNPTWVGWQCFSITSLRVGRSILTRMTICTPARELANHQRASVRSRRIDSDSPASMTTVGQSLLCGFRNRGMNDPSASLEQVAPRNLIARR